jgi:hypothetical protein
VVSALDVLILLMVVAASGGIIASALQISRSIGLIPSLDRPKTDAIVEESAQATDLINRSWRIIAESLMTPNRIQGRLEPLAQSMITVDLKIDRSSSEIVNLIRKELSGKALFLNSDAYAPDIGVIKRVTPLSIVYRKQFQTQPRVAAYDFSELQSGSGDQVTDIAFRGGIH